MPGQTAAKLAALSRQLQTLIEEAQRVRAEVEQTLAKTKRSDKKLTALTERKRVVAEPADTRTSSIADRQS
jgi:hypothetical protein